MFISLSKNKIQPLTSSLTKFQNNMNIIIIIIIFMKLTLSQKKKKKTQSSNVSRKINAIICMVL